MLSPSPGTVVSRVKVERRGTRTGTGIEVIVRAVDSMIVLNLLDCVDSSFQSRPHFLGRVVLSGSLRSIAIRSAKVGHVKSTQVFSADISIDHPNKSRRNVVQYVFTLPPRDSGFSLERAAYVRNLNSQLYQTCIYPHCT